MAVFAVLVAFVVGGFLWFDHALGEYLDEIGYQRYVSAGWIVALVRRPEDPEAQRLRIRALKRGVVAIGAVVIGLPAVVVVARGRYLLAGGQ